MSRKLHSLFSNLASASHESELRAHFMANAGDIVAATAWGWKFFADDFRVIDCEFHGLPSSILQHYEEVGYRYDPLMCFAIQYHAPVHEEVILTPKNWQHSIIYQHVFSRYGIEHLAITKCQASPDRSFSWGWSFTGKNLFYSQQKYTTIYPGKFDST
ncbi:MAG: hypothetical protein AB4206_20760 [Xenococcaceae cyanobacterium]